MHNARFGIVHYTLSISGYSSLLFCRHICYDYYIAIGRRNNLNVIR